MKNIKLYIILSALAVALSFQNSFAQGYNNERKSLPPRDVIVYLEVVGDSVYVSPEEITAGNTDRVRNQVFDAKVIINLFSIANVKKIHVKLGTKEGLADVADQIFTFDDKRNLRPPFSYERKDKTIIMNVGKVIGYKDYYAEVIMEDENGKKSEPKGSKKRE